MRIEYDRETDILVLNLDPSHEHTRGELVETQGLLIGLQLDGDDRLVSIEIVDASKCVNLAQVLPVAVASG